MNDRDPFIASAAARLATMTPLSDPLEAQNILKYVLLLGFRSEALVEAGDKAVNSCLTRVSQVSHTVINQTIGQRAAMLLLVQTADLTSRKHDLVSGDYRIMAPLITLLRADFSAFKTDPVVIEQIIQLLPQATLRGRDDVFDFVNYALRILKDNSDVVSAVEAEVHTLASRPDRLRELKQTLGIDLPSEPLIGSNAPAAPSNKAEERPLDPNLNNFWDALKDFPPDLLAAIQGMARVGQWDRSINA